MWRITTRRLLVATFWVGVALAALRIDTKEPDGILVASLAIAFAVVSLLIDSTMIRSERAAVGLLVFTLCGSLIVIGLAYAILGR